MDTEDFQSLRAKFQSAERCSTLPANYTRPQKEQTPAPNISNVRSNPALLGVISALEGKTKPAPSSVKPPVLAPKPNGLSVVPKLLSVSAHNSNKNSLLIPRAKVSPEFESMKLNKGFRQTLHIMDNPRTEGDGMCDNLPQVYRASCPTFPELKPNPPQPAMDDCYEVVDSDFLPYTEPSPAVNDLIKSANCSPSILMHNKPWRSVESGHSSPSPEHSSMKADSSLNLDGGNGKQKKYCVNKTPRLNSLPPIESLGLPPPKDPRPPKVDLSAFLTEPQQEETDEYRTEAVGSEYECIPSPAMDEGECYEEALNVNESEASGNNIYEVEELHREPFEAEKNEDFVTSPTWEYNQESYEDALSLRKAENDCNVYELEEIDTLPDPDPPEGSYYEVSEGDKDLGFSGTAMGTYPSFTSSVSEGYYSSGEVETDKVSLSNMSLSKDEQAFRKKFKISGQESPIYTATIVEDFKTEKYTLPVKKGDAVNIIRISDCRPGKWLAQDERGNYGFVPVACIETSQDVFNYHNSPSSLAPVIPENKQTRTQNSAADLYVRSNSYSAKYEDTYDDIVLTPSSSGGKNKGFGNLFRKDKGKKEDLGPVYMTPNTNMMSQEGAENVTHSVNTPHENTIHLREKEDKSAGWRSLFHTNKEARGRTDSLGTEGKLAAPGVMKKFAKEEKIFREKFKYTGDINVQNIATVNDLAPLSTKEKLELAVKPGETVEVIDVVNDEQIICRNFAGKYGYVRIEYLNFASLRVEGTVVDK
ncbi:FYN-binding protein 2 isoform X3 [Mixophyes fleayi]|uniref:FYN-binding protein 2 isoform X3 n=1 Tax=Mixophyes fleayi TaxID=3061075 RepID=UPI003F4E44FC